MEDDGYMLNEDGSVMSFNTGKEARDFLLASGYPDINAISNAGIQILEVFYEFEDLSEKQIEEAKNNLIAIYEYLAASDPDDREMLYKLTHDEEALMDRLKQCFAFSDKNGTTEVIL